MVSKTALQLARTKTQREVLRLSSENSVAFVLLISPFLVNVMPPGVLKTTRLT